jgi:hypothetical protein
MRKSLRQAGGRCVDVALSDARDGEFIAEPVRLDQRPEPLEDRQRLLEPRTCCRLIA